LFFPDGQIFKNHRNSSKHKLSTNSLYKSQKNSSLKQLFCTRLQFELFFYGFWIVDRQLITKNFTDGQIFHNHRNSSKSVFGMTTGQMRWHLGFTSYFLEFIETCTKKFKLKSCTSHSEINPFLLFHQSSFWTPYDLSKENIRRFNEKKTRKGS
jgi:hypothetical protein